MGAPLGNQNAAKGKRWAAAVERALGRRVTNEKPPEDVSDLIRGLDAAADIFVAQLFDSRDLGYFKELGDRFDGKPSQTVDVGSDVMRAVRELGCVVSHVGHACLSNPDVGTI